MKYPLLLLTSMFFVLVFFFLTGLGLIMEKSVEEKGAPFECGFSPLGLLSIPFSTPFFVLSLVFLLFDVEIILVSLYPLFSSYDTVFLMVDFFVIILILLATLFEWAKGILKWV